MIAIASKREKQGRDVRIKSSKRASVQSGRATGLQRIFSSVDLRLFCNLHLTVDPGPMKKATATEAAKEAAKEAATEAATEAKLIRKTIDYTNEAEDRANGGEGNSLHDEYELLKIDTQSLNH